MENEWLLLAYSLTAEPSRARVAVWRRLRKLGAVYVDGGFWCLPNTPALTEAAREVAAEIRGQGGTANVFAANELDAEQSQRLRSRFNQAREQEYAEVIGQCERFLAHVQRATGRKDFEFAEVEELEHDLDKRQRWFSQIRERDVFGVEARSRAEKLLQECREALDHFIDQAYEHGVGELNAR
jgi:hypothetical protein